MALKDGAVFVGELTTVGRKTGRPRSVELRFVYLAGKFYASSARVSGKHWCQNMLKNPAVGIKADAQLYRCRAQQVTDEVLRKRVLTLRDSRALMDRVVFEIAPEE
ncbi:MAG: nitroreductase/quinone reductase family protein [Candidatus Binatia bacterium]